MKSRLRYSSQPYPDEAVSSWLSRIALLNGAPGDEFIQTLGLQSPDPDFDLAANDLDRLSALTEVPTTTVKLLPLRERFAGLIASDLIERDPQTGVRAQVCAYCLDRDAREERDHYVRAEWLLIWVAHCPTHHQSMLEIERVELAPQVNGGARRRVVRFVRAVDDVIDPNRRKVRSPAGARGLATPASGLLSRDILAALRRGKRFENWDCDGAWSNARMAFIALADFLVSVDAQGNSPLLTRMITPDIKAATNLGVARPRAVLRRLTPPMRAIVLDVLAGLLMNPQRYSLVALHSHGPRGFYCHFRPAPPRFRGPLSQAAILDPLAVLLALGNQAALGDLLRYAHKWPVKLRQRVGYASAVALAAV